MEKSLKFLRIILLCFCIITLSFCKNGTTHQLPELETINPTEITQTSAKSGGYITYDGGSEISERGICWATSSEPSVKDMKTIDGIGPGSYISSMIGLNPGSTYYVKAYASNDVGTSYGSEKSFRTASLDPQAENQIIADHTIVDKFDDIPQYYIDQVKKMWLVTAGESHSEGYRVGLIFLENALPSYQVNVTNSGIPEAYTTSHLRASRATWGSYDTSSGWVYDYGEEDWWTNPTAISRTKAGLTYCNSIGLLPSAIGFGWCYDPYTGTSWGPADPVYGVHWMGETYKGPDGSMKWGLDDDDFSLTGNRLNTDSYLKATQEYIDYCAANGYSTKVYFTTGPVDTYNGTYGPENMYQAYLKYEHIRSYVKSDPTRILFDYADILCYDDDGTLTTTTWNSHTFPSITATNLGAGDVAHISSPGTLRLAKALWWMLARMAGWDGM